VAINATGEIFKNYDGSYVYGYTPFEPDQCQGGSSYVNHGVTVVGYGTMEKYCKNDVCHQGVDYFIFKNSYGKPWGSEGYGAIWAGEVGSTTGICGILTQMVVV
jgi:C1A family cysteine protease